MFVVFLHARTLCDFVFLLAFLGGCFGFASLRFGLGLFVILVIWLFGLVTVLLRGLFDLVFLVGYVVFGFGWKDFLHFCCCAGILLFRVVFLEFCALVFSSVSGYWVLGFADFVTSEFGGLRFVLV